MIALNVIVFPGGFNLPAWAAQRQGFFEASGVRVSFTPTPSSTFQMQGLAEGTFDIAMTAFDNVVAYQEGQGEAKMPDAPDLFAFMGSDNGFLSVMGGKGIARFPDLRGRNSRSMRSPRVLLLSCASCSPRTASPNRKSPSSVPAAWPSASRDS